jgi:hypothetical protein
MAEYIEREALMKRLDVSPLFSNIRDGGFFIKDGVLDIVQKQPAADVVEVRHGYWKDNRNGTFTCSVCGGQSSKMDWCGRCGAKMDGKGDEK